MSYGFWLGDAFASGGSVGYDHKAMGITAKGAWESVKRHFRELGVDTQQEEFTVVGVGDMSGDVFGNGMLLSRHIRLLAAFDHRHVFVDDRPDLLEGVRHVGGEPRFLSLYFEPDLDPAARESLVAGWRSAEEHRAWVVSRDEAIDAAVADGRLETARLESFRRMLGSGQ